MMAAAPLHTKSLSIGYPERNGKFAAIQRNINLNLENSEITCLLGPNGTGKSTLIRTLSGFQKPVDGEVWIAGENISLVPASKLARRVGVVLTEQVGVGNMTVFDMVAFGRSPYTGFIGRLGEEDRIKVEQALSDTGIISLHDRKFSELSDGERQKVMIAKTLAQETPLIFLDEPTAYLDFPSKVEIMQLLRNAAWSQSKSILLSTHDLNLAIKFADRIWLMGKDKPMMAGVPEDLIVEGHFGSFFDKEKIIFDVETGNFNFDTMPGQSIRVKGTGLKIKWLTEALKRKGYLVNTSDPEDIMVEQQDSDFKIRANEKLILAASISDVLKHLQVLKRTS